MREGCLGNGIAFFASQSEEIRALWGSAGSGSTPGWAVPGEAHWHTGFVSAEGALSSTPLQWLCLLGKLVLRVLSMPLLLFTDKHAEM